MTPCPQVAENEEKNCGMDSGAAEFASDMASLWSSLGISQSGDWGSWEDCFSSFSFLTVLRNCIWEEAELMDGSRTNTNANPFDGKCPLELQTKPLLLNCCIWGHRGSQGSGELTFHTRAMGTVRTGKLLLRSHLAPGHTLDVYNCLRNPHGFFTLQPHNRGQEQTNSDQLDGKWKGKNSHGSIITSVSTPSERLPQTQAATEGQTLK